MVSGDFIDDLDVEIGFWKWLMFDDCFGDVEFVVDCMDFVFE